MMDAILNAFVDQIVAARIGYGRTQQVDIRADGKPPPNCGDVFVAVHQGATRNSSLNNLDEYYDLSVTLTMRVTIPFDRLGDQLLARKLAKKIGFNRRAERLRNLLNMAWETLQTANNYLVDLNPDAQTIYGFVEPPHYTGMEIPQFVGEDWFDAEPDSGNTGLKSELRFADARRMQPAGTFT